MTDAALASTAVRPAVRQPEWLVLVLLSTLCALAYFYRMLWSVLVIAMKADLRLSDTELGLLGGLGFSLSYAVLALPLAAVIDRSNRVTILTLCAALWSLASAGCGLVYALPTLFVMRALVGVGEAGCLPASQSILADAFPPQRRTFAFGILEASGASA